MDLAKSLEQVATFLDKGGYRWAIIGGLAMQAYGLSRATQDVDFVVEAVAQGAVVERMGSLGYETLHLSAGFSNHLHPDQALGRIDFAYVDAATADRLFASCLRFERVLGRAVAVPSPEHLIAMKVHAAKNDPSRMLREMADVEYLLGRPDVDPESVRRYFEAAGLTRWLDDLTRQA